MTPSSCPGMTSVAGTARPGYTARARSKNVRDALDRCGGRRPDGPRADARHLGNPRRRHYRRAGSAGFGTSGQGFRHACGPAANGVQLSADLWSLSAHADGILDFTVPGATIANVAIAAERGLVHIIGTTGLSASDEAVIKSVTSRAIVVKSGNMSLGINLLAALVKRVAQSLDESFDIEILEMHHKAKIDAPSGTAYLLGEAAAAGRGIVLDEHSARGRDGNTGARRPGDIGFASLRGGTVTGDYSVVFAGSMERIELTHRAEDRTMFAQGAIKPALWARDQKPGFYSMTHVLGL